MKRRTAGVLSSILSAVILVSLLPASVEAKPLQRDADSELRALLPDEGVGPSARDLAAHFGPSSTQAPSATGAPAQGPLLAVKVGLLIDGTGSPPVRDAVVLIRSGRIIQVGSGVEVPREAVVVDASRQVVMPGLIDTHVHLGERAIIDKSPEYEEQVRQNLRQNLAFGVTTVFSLGMDRDFIWGLREKSWGTDFNGSHILTAGTGFTAPGGHPTQLKIDFLNQTNDPEEARSFVRKLAGRKVDGIKIWFADLPGLSNLPQIKPEVASAIIDEGHKSKLRVVAHINTAADTKLLVKMGLDAITHIARDPLDDETVALMKSRGVILAPTLVSRKKALIFKEESALLDDATVRSILGKEAEDLKRDVARAKPEALEASRKSYEQAKESVLRLQRAGVTLAVGTDANTNFAPPGLITQREVEALVDAGLSPMEALVAATRGSARWAGVTDRIGTIEPGKIADLLILDANPLDDIRNIRRISRIVIGGRVVEPLQIR